MYVSACAFGLCHPFSHLPSLLLDYEQQRLHLLHKHGIDLESTHGNSLGDGTRTRRLDRKEVERLMGGDGQGGIFTWREKNSRKVCLQHHLTVVALISSNTFTLCCFHSLRIPCKSIHFPHLLSHCSLSHRLRHLSRCGTNSYSKLRVNEPIGSNLNRPSSVPRSHSRSWLLLLLRLVESWCHYV